MEQLETVTPEAIITEEAAEATVTGMANPASVYCNEQGGHLEIHTDTEGNQYGMCVFSNGQECEEWAFFRGECDAQTTIADIDVTTSERVVDWVGVIRGTSQGAQFNDYFEWLSFEGGAFGIDAQEETIAAQITALRDTGKQVHIWGNLVTNVPDYNGKQILITHLTVDEKPEAPEIVTESVDNWVGVVVSIEQNAQFDDYFQMLDQNGSRFGIWGEEDLGVQIEALRDTGTVIHIWGQVRYNVPDAYNTQIAVTRLEVE
ncbi:MAG: DUF333 domain-containing protein [Anaerolineae bacterium]|nr:DUF333 domain-containing protein [Anaerolineae bacterium]